MILMVKPYEVDGVYHDMGTTQSFDEKTEAQLVVSHIAEYVTADEPVKRARRTRAQTGDVDADNAQAEGGEA